MSSADFVYVQINRLVSTEVRNCGEALKNGDPQKAAKILSDIERRLKDLAVHVASIPRS